ncbi:uncharacterized protein ACLA_074960 [Aspergillus clavatus NRRL 1]|uniref:Myb-like DNA-binding domain-containing protein n=1 Tax=Aspergillus clavatus (strain ATCC 1007 / CBS 513.65 / DSM 816 / NCTC 3887 / NRRL 1 / QM 1276 / 107) TaxID=344612 RepID=A1C7T7_ASPCL|nr:uncharacterized protein ACLA_074960 [Aspergillus clavatus NRRL 1]EAW14458.1 conserved hypothetical protein [Aspergillus clavatus NRRL 1]
MPKATIDENHVFMYHLVQSIGDKTIDYDALAQAVNLNKPAARMRWSRLKARIEEARTENNNDDNRDATTPQTTEPVTESETSSPVKKKRRTLKRKRSAGDEDGARDGDAGAATAD